MFSKMIVSIISSKKKGLAHVLFFPSADIWCIIEAYCSDSKVWQTNGTYILYYYKFSLCTLFLTFQVWLYWQLARFWKNSGCWLSPKKHMIFVKPTNSLDNLYFTLENLFSFILFPTHIFSKKVIYLCVCVRGSRHWWNQNTQILNSER